MPATKELRATWRDSAWFAPGAPEPFLLTRDEVLARVAALHLDATERDLRFWEAEGILPRPVRRRHAGATRALYPAWFVDLIYKLRDLQLAGLSLKELPSRLQAEARRLSLVPLVGPPDDDARKLPPSLLRSMLESEFGQLVRQWVIASLPPPQAAFPNPKHPPIVSDASLETLSDVVTVIAQVYSEYAGIEIERGELRLTDKHGRQLPPLVIPLRAPSKGTEDRDTSK